MRKTHLPALFLALLLFLAPLCGCAAGPRLTVTFLDVGKADCILLTLEDHAAVIDCGEQDDAEDLLAALAQAGVEELDFLLLTHLDKDHIGGADVLLENVPVGALYAPDYDKGNKQYEQYVEALEKVGIEPVHPTEALSFAFGPALITLLPGEKAAYEESNDYSIFLALEYGQTSFLFAGDAEEERLKEYLDSDWADRRFDVLKVPHHGRACDLTEAFFAAVSPRFAVITCSEEEMPDEEVVSGLQALGAKVYGTVYGDVTVVSDGETLSIR